MLLPTPQLSLAASVSTAMNSIATTSRTRVRPTIEVLFFPEATHPAGTPTEAIDGAVDPKRHAPPQDVGQPRAVTGRVCCTIRAVRGVAQAHRIIEITDTR
jgi:hypothetical protein